MVLGGEFLGAKPLLGDENRPNLSIWRLTGLTLCYMGVQFGWAIQIAYTTPLFLQLGVPKGLVSFVWLAGPVSGLIVQPTVGVFSDRHGSKLGRRRPFIIAGLIAIVIAMALISNSPSLGHLVGDTPPHQPASIVIAIIGFWLLDLANNTVQGPCRALLADNAPFSQHNLGGSMFSFMLGFGNLGGYFTGSLNLKKYLPFFQTNLQALFTIGIAVVSLCVTISICSVKEKRYEVLSKEENPLFRTFKGLWRMSSAMRRLCAVQFFSWLAWFTFILYITGWMGENVFKGDPLAPEGSEAHTRFNEGVRAASLGLSINAGITIVVSMLLPYLAKYCGIRVIYFLGQVTLAFCLGLTVWIESKIGAIIIIGACGFPWAVSMVFPFTLVALANPAEDYGLSIGIMNIFVVIPQMLVSLCIGVVISHFHNNLAAALAVGSASALLSSFLVWRLIEERENPLIEDTDGVTQAS